MTALAAGNATGARLGLAAFVAAVLLGVVDGTGARRRHRRLGRWLEQLLGRDGAFAALHVLGQFHQFLLGRRLLWFRGRGRGLLLQRRWNRKAGTRLGAQRRAVSPRALPDATGATGPTRPAGVGSPRLLQIAHGAAWGDARRSLGARVRRSLASIRRR